LINSNLQQIPCQDCLTGHTELRYVARIIG